MTDELKPCPFCGEDRASYVNVSMPDSGYINCLACESSYGEILPFKEAIKAWNTRTHPKAEMLPNGELVKVIAQAILKVAYAGHENMELLLEEAWPEFKAEAQGVIAALPPTAGTDVVSNDGWVPIETAPKDHSRIDLWVTCAKHPSIPEFAERTPTRWAGCFWSGSGWYSDDLYDCGDTFDEGTIITHWRPLPTKPTQKSEE